MNIEKYCIILSLYYIAMANAKSTRDIRARRGVSKKNKSRKNISQLGGHPCDGVKDKWWDSRANDWRCAIDRDRRTPEQILAEKQKFEDPPFVWQHITDDQKEGYLQAVRKEEMNKKGISFQSVASSVSNILDSSIKTWRSKEGGRTALVTLFDNDQVIGGHIEASLGNGVLESCLLHGSDGKYYIGPSALIEFCNVPGASEVKTLFNKITKFAPSLLAMRNDDVIRNFQKHFQNIF
jgi:hypothetical protein